VIVADFPLAPSPEQSEEVVKPSQPAIGTDEQESDFDTLIWSHSIF
jgi:hypothetical protein